MRVGLCEREELCIIAAAGDELLSWHRMRYVFSRFLFGADSFCFVPSVRPALRKNEVGAEIGPTDVVAAADEARWLELYSKHEGAWRAWIAQSQAAQPQASSFVNYV